MIIQMTTAVLLGLATFGQPADPIEPPAIDIQLRLVRFTPQAEDPAVGTLFGENPEGEALLRIPGVSMESPVRDLFVERDHYTLTSRGADMDELLAHATSRGIIKQLTAPRVLALLNQPASVRVGRSLQYIKRGEDGCLQVVEDDAQREGVAIDLLVGEASAERIVFREITVEVSEVVGRLPLEGVPFEVGRPVIGTRKARMELSLAPNQVGVFPIPRASEEDLPVLLFLTARQRK